MGRSITKTIIRLSLVIPLSAGLALSTTSLAHAGGPPPSDCTVTVKTLQGHEIAGRTITGTGTVKCDSFRRPLIRLALQKNGSTQHRTSKDCGTARTCTAYTKTVFRATGTDWCTQIQVEWGLSTTIKWDCL
ncbi:hypothetical protein ABZ897_29265 [Nonomuraea sp. NPDC046802]|uniref:hypothetical protein n=1 Tax=Nonomuraea sp. NPDC046802 TaxID=3154919 RepID=UPI0033D9F82B